MTPPSSKRSKAKRFPTGATLRSGVRLVGLSCLIVLTLSTYLRRKSDSATQEEGATFSRKTSIPEIAAFSNVGASNPHTSEELISCWWSRCTIRNLRNLDSAEWDRLSSYSSARRDRLLREVRDLARTGKDQLLEAFCDLFLLSDTTDRLMRLAATGGDARDCYLMGLLSRREPDLFQKSVALLLCDDELFSDPRIRANAEQRSPETSGSEAKWALRDQINSGEEEDALLKAARIYCDCPGHGLRLLLAAMTNHPWIVDKVIKPLILKEGSGALSISAVQELELYLNCEDVSMLRTISLTTDNSAVAVQCFAASESLSPGDDEWLIALAERFDYGTVQWCIAHLASEGKDPSSPVWERLFSSRLGESGAAWVLSRDDGKSFSHDLRELALKHCLGSKDPAIQRVGMRYMSLIRGSIKDER